MARIAARDDGWCFVCGRHNPHGLQLDFELEAKGRLSTRFRPGREHSGFAGLTHGGLLASVLDELMVRLLYLLDVRAVSSDLKLRYLKPTPIGRETLGTAWIAVDRGRLIDMEAELVDAETGETLVRAESRCLRAAR